MFALARFADCREALRNWPVFSSAQGVMMNDLMNETLIGIVLCADGEEHAAMRKVIGGPLTPQALGGGAAPRSPRRPSSLVERLVAKGTFDAATELAHHLPVTIVSELVGLPGGRPRAHARLGRRQLQLLRADEPADARSAFPVVREMVDYAFTRVRAGEADAGRVGGRHLGGGRAGRHPDGEAAAHDERLHGPEPRHHDLRHGQHDLAVRHATRTSGRCCGSSPT